MRKLKRFQWVGEMFLFSFLLQISLDAFRLPGWACVTISSAVVVSVLVWWNWRTQ